MERIYIDTETTGLGEDAEVIEIGIIDQNGKVLFESLVKPLQPVPAEATEIHGISNEDLLEAPCWPEIHNQVNKIIAAADVVAIYNDVYDRRILKQTASLYDLEICEYCSECIMRLYANLYFYGDWQSLGDACSLENIDTSDLTAHRAVADCEMTRRLHQVIIKTEAKKEKQRDYYLQVKARKLALVPADKSDFPYYGQSRPTGHKTLTQLKLKELDQYEFAGECCSAYGDRGYLFKPKQA